MSATVAEIRLGDDPGAWARAGFLVEHDTVVVAPVRIVLAATGGPSWSLCRSTGETTGPAEIDGLATHWLAPSTFDAPLHPNGCSALDHVVVATPDVERTAGAFESLGMRVRARRDASGPNGPMRQAFVRDGAVVIEIVGPATPAHHDATRSTPATLWGLAFVSDDLDATAEVLGPSLGPVRDAVQPGRRIASVRHRDLGVSVPVAIMSR